MQFLIKIFLIVLMAMTADASFAGDSVVALVKIKDSGMAVDLASPCESTPSSICMSVWSRYTLRVERIVAGEETREILHALRIEGGAPYYYEDEVALVVLEPITDSSKQRLANASYTIKKLIRSSYCFDEPLSQYGLRASQTVDRNCYQSTELHRQKD